MSHCQAALLTDRGLLSVKGADAHKFLQGVITNDLVKADKGATHAALLTPQGKILFEFFVVGHGADYLIEGAKDSLGDLATQLGFYRLRAKVEIKLLPDFRVAAVWDGEPDIPEGAIAFTDPRLAALGMRVLLPGHVDVADLACANAGEAAYHAFRIALGVPEGGRDYVLGDTFPHEALFDRLNGIDFQKGCFVGQEVVSRMQHRGTTRKRVVPIEGDADLVGGTQIKAGDLPLGTIGSVDGSRGLALLRIDRAEDAAAKGTPLQAGTVTIRARGPGFAAFGGPAAPAGQPA
jgi:folate-binding protein YgfZ